MEATNTLYKRVLDITYDYLGPAAPRFIDRQIMNHLSKTPEELQPQDMPVLINWVKIALALLIDDKHVVSEFAERLHAVAEKKRRTNDLAAK